MATKRAIKQALRDYCNLRSDIDEISQVSKEMCAEDKAYATELKRRVHEYMQSQRIDCMFDVSSGKFVYRASRKTAKPLSEDMQALIVEEVEKQEREGKLTFVDVETLLLDVIHLIQEVRSTQTETLKIGDKKPASVADAVTPHIPEVAQMLKTYVEMEEKLKQASALVSNVKSQLGEKLNEVVPIVREYCATHKIVKKPMNFRRQWSTTFTKSVAHFDPTYMQKTTPQTTRRYLQYKQSKARNRKITTLRPSKKHMAEVLENITSSRSLGWTHSKVVKQLFVKLYEEAEQAVEKKLQENETAPVFKVSLGAKLGLDD